MTKKVTSISEKKGKKRNVIKDQIITKLRGKYPRMELGHRGFEPISPKDEKYYWPVNGEESIRLAGTLADDGYQKAGTLSLSDLIAVKLDHVIYRTLKAAYGFPDVLAGIVLKEDTSSDGDHVKKVWPTEWGYLLEGKNGNCVEIFKRFRDHDVQITLWLLSSEQLKELPSDDKIGFDDFPRLLSELSKLFDNEYSAKEEEKKAALFPGSNRLINNLYYQNMQSGKVIIELAGQLVPEIMRERKKLWDSGLRVKSFDQLHKMTIFYVSAILFYLMALEGFVNLLYKFFLLPQYSYRDFERVTRRGDLDLRILHLPAYCRGFSNACITPSDTLYQKVIEMRDLRNNLVHANITDENEGFVTFEDWFMFEYNSLCHLREGKGKSKKKKMHTQQFAIGNAGAVVIEQQVEKIVADIIDKMDKKEKLWVKSWIDAGRITWVPGTEDFEYHASLNAYWKNEREIVPDE